MAKAKKKAITVAPATANWSDTLISDMNKSMGKKVFFDLTDPNDSKIADINHWTSTGSRLLDGMCSNKILEGGLPEGRIIEIYGKTGIGKSHLAYQICRDALDQGGFVVYADTEHATNPENLWNLGIFRPGDKERASRFIFAQPDTLEEVFELMEHTMAKANEIRKIADVPVVFIWDSIAASATKSELEGDFDDQRPALTARALSRNFKKVVPKISKSKILVVALNQVREKIGVMYGNPETTPGGRALPFYSSVRIALHGGQMLTDKSGNTYGITVKAKTVKNKLVSPFRVAEFEIHFGVGIKDHQQIYDILAKHGPETINGEVIEVSGGGAWKYLNIDGEEVKKFHKSEFDKVLDNSEFKDLLDTYLAKAIETKMGAGGRQVDKDNYEEVLSLVEESTDGVDELED